ncbi:hypothetical protein K493DRAFT_316044, partial [Basidiobolus meristosporus CBS 931.73]
MKFGASILLALSATSAASAAVYLRRAEAGNSCTDATTYNQCFDNIMTTTCEATDAACNCQLSKGLMACLSFCNNDPVLASLGNAQQSETEKWCNAPSSASTTSTSTGASTTPSTTEASAGPASTTDNNTSPSKDTQTPTTTPNNSNKVKLASGLIALTGMVALLM